MNKLIKLFISIICILILINFTNIFSYRVSASFLSDAKNFAQSGGSSSVDVSSVTTDLVTIGQVLTSVGVGVLVLATTYLGIMYFISGPEAQGKLKGQLFGLVAAAVVIFGSYGIWKIAVNIAEQISFS